MVTDKRKSSIAERGARDGHQAVHEAVELMEAQEEAAVAWIAVEVSRGQLAGADGESSLTGSGDGASDVVFEVAFEEAEQHFVALLVGVGAAAMGGAED